MPVRNTARARVSAKIQNDHFRKMLTAAYIRGLRPKHVLFDGGYHSLDNLNHLCALGFTYLTRFKFHWAPGPAGSPSGQQGLSQLYDPSGLAHPARQPDRGLDAASLPVAGLSGPGDSTAYAGVGTVQLGAGQSGPVGVHLRPRLTSVHALPTNLSSG